MGNDIMDNLIGSLEKLVPTIASRRAEIEKARRLPRDLVDDLRTTGVFALEYPRALGGREASPLDIVRAIETVARGDGSTGWCVANAVAAGGIVGFMSEAGAKELFADPNTPTAGVFAPSGAAVRVDGGVKVSGRWQFASGVTHADWLWAGCMVMENGQPRMTPMGPEIVYAWLPTKSVEIHDTWHVSGLAGTGSHDISVKDAFVPEKYTFLIGDPTRCRREPLYKLPPLAWYVAHIAPVSLGIARAALDEVTELAEKRTPTFTMTPLAEQPFAHIEIARAEATLAAARALLHETLADVWRVVSAGSEPTPRQVAMSRVAANHAVEIAANVTRAAGILGGGHAIHATSSLQRHMRDADALAHHFSISPGVWADAGRVFLGRKPNAPMF
jgi:alkylation response protein AidB-like acyl-CoA dehydrogenase